MTDLRTRLRDALFDDEDERLSADDIAAMRRVVVASVRTTDERERRAASWFQPLAVAATVVAMIGVGIAIGGRFDGGATVATAPRGDERGAAAQQPERARQLQFSTPGGTRIIWIFTSDLELKTTP
jgi:hypothetical protein